MMFGRSSFPRCLSCHSLSAPLLDSAERQQTCREPANPSPDPLPGRRNSSSFGYGLVEFVLVVRTQPWGSFGAVVSGRLRAEAGRSGRDEGDFGTKSPSLSCKHKSCGGGGS